MIRIGLILLSLSLAGAAEVPLRFERIPLSETTYEAASAFDVNNDGVIDIFSGGFWYEGPNFKTAHKVCDLAPIDTYYDDFSNYPMDVNGDGYLDIVTGGYWGLKLFWRENPKGGPGEWTTHTVAEVGNIERNVFYDLDGDGVVEVLPVTQPMHIFRLKRDASGKGAGGFEQFTIQAKGGGGHGCGCGDVNGDGHPDIILAGGWFEAPADTWAMDKWVWHSDFNLGRPSVPILVYDVNNDGVNDLIIGEAHDYGLYWMEQQQGQAGRTQWEKHMIEADRSQYHDIQLVDIDNDGALELVTGKRYHAHNGHDPGGADPLGVYYFDNDAGNFSRTTLDYGPPDRASGAGIYFWVADIDGNGWKDLIAPGKEGLYLFKNQGR